VSVGRATELTIPPSGDSTSVAPFLRMASGGQGSVKQSARRGVGCARAGLGDELDAQAAEQRELRYSWLQSSG